MPMNEHKTLETNLHLDDKDSELREKGQALIDAAYEFWRARQKVSSPGAVVWIKDTSGHFVLFTRGEYLNEIMSRINPLAAEEPLTSPFELPTDDLIAAAVYAEAWFTNRDCVDPHSMDYRAFQAADK